jgi:hypothetical protein
MAVCSCSRASDKSILRTFFHVIDAAGKGQVPHSQVGLVTLRLAEADTVLRPLAMAHALPHGTRNILRRVYNDPTTTRARTQIPEFFRMAHHLALLTYQPSEAVEDMFRHDKYTRTYRIPGWTPPGASSAPSEGK